MRKVLIKSLLLVVAYGSVLLLDGCWTRCRCGDVPPFFDFGKVHLVQEGVYGPGQIAITGYFDDVEYYMASNCHSGLGLNSLYACSCPEPGEEGAKFPINRVDIYSLDSFNDSLPPGASLNDAFSLNSNGGAEYALNLRPLEVTAFGVFRLYSTEAPQDTSLPQNIWVELGKSNGEVVTSDTIPLYWNQ